ncbi:hypothetical protein GCM10022222_33770 [Amycolatopsis ultiminotia]|uniref:STAS domain-containing protein n=1 Tax=Amycolatopsis ultiminotia TaxID=543629 RepID=A0ABP6WBY9_9PSEU
MSAVEVLRPPARAGRRIRIRTLVADRRITVAATGWLTGADVPALAAELGEAVELCCGVVVLDVRGCVADRAAIVAAMAEASRYPPGTRCTVRVVTDDRTTGTALDAAGIVWHTSSGREHGST